LVVLDEAYIDFAEDEGYLPKLNNYSNLIVLQTFSKAWGLASIRLGMAFASHAVISILNKIKYPYNINILTQKYALEAVDNDSEKRDWVKLILSNKELLLQELETVRIVEKIYDSDANFVLVKVEDPKLIYDFLVENKIIVRNRTNISLCEGCIRITVGTQEENDTLVKALKKY
jgi:histidinol-phosphate aminotransferase